MGPGLDQATRALDAAFLHIGMRRHAEGFAEPTHECRGAQADDPGQRLQRERSVQPVLHKFDDVPTLRRSQSTEARRLARILLALMPDEEEVAGLLGLLLLTESRRAARTSPSTSTR